MRRVAPSTVAVACTRWCSAVPTPKGTVAMATPDSEQKVQEFAKLYSQMTLKEITALQRAIFKELGHSDDFYEQALLRGLGGGGGGGAPVVMAAAPAAGGAAPAAEAKEEEAAAPAKKQAEKSAYDVNLKAYPKEVKIKLIKELRTVTQLPLKEAKDVIDKAPGLIAKNLGKDDAEKLKTLLAAHGAEVELQ